MRSAFEKNLHYYYFINDENSAEKDIGRVKIVSCLVHKKKFVYAIFLNIYYYEIVLKHGCLLHSGIYLEIMLYLVSFKHV